MIVVGTFAPKFTHTQRVLVGARAGVPLLLVVIAHFTWVVVGRALHPVEAIRRRADEIGARQLDQRVPVPPLRDEVGRSPSR
ncbi:MAG: HAMP domain-containing protein [Ilumatobacteraceae bacterium]